MDPNINNQIEEDHNEDELWYDGDYEDEEDRDEYYERQKEAKNEEIAERAAMCTCGAWVIGKDGNGYHVADCICGAE